MEDSSTFLGKGQFYSTKLFDGFSTVFRQHIATGTHCRFLHGYGLKVRVKWTGELDERNWVVDFGGFKRAINKISIGQPGISYPPKEWLNWLLDHTVILAEDDPFLEHFKDLKNQGVLQLRTLPRVGCEMFARHIFETLAEWASREYGDRVKLHLVEVFEHEKNSAIYKKS